MEKKKNGWFKWGAMVGCLCLVITGVIFLSQQNILSSVYISILSADSEGKDNGGNDGIMYSVAVYPVTESEENVKSTDVLSLTENEALNNSLAGHLPKQLPEGFHYGRGSIYNTVMKDGTQYSMLRVQYTSGEIPRQQFTEDSGAIAPDPETMGDLLWLDGVYGIIAMLK